MKHAFFLAPAGTNVGLTTIALGLVSSLDRRGIRVAFFKPIAQRGTGDSLDRSTHFVRATTTLRPADPIPFAIATKTIAEQGLDALMGNVIAAYHESTGSADAVVVEGLLPAAGDSYLGLVSQELVKTLNAQVILVASRADKTMGQVDDQVEYDAKLFGPTEIETVAKSQDVEIPENLEILNPARIRANYVVPLFEARKHKGLSMEMASSQLEDNVVLGTMMIAVGEVDGLVSGAVHSTANTIRPALQIVKTKKNARAVSSIFFMCLPEQVLVYGDCAVIPDPDAETLADIAIQSADSAAAFGIPPRVAMISYSTGESGSGVDVEKVREATKLAKTKRPDLLIDGPLQYDAAFMPDVARTKAPNSPVAGRATVFIFPDLNTGNTTYKAVQRSANVISIGPMLQGLKRPVNDLSRGALVDDIVYTIALTALQATQA